MNKVVELRLESGRILFYRNNNPEGKPEYGFWIDADGFMWFVETHAERIVARQSYLRFPDEVAKDG